MKTEILEHIGKLLKDNKAQLKKRIEASNKSKKMGRVLRICQRRCGDTRSFLGE